MALSQFVYGSSPGVQPAHLLGRGGTAEEAAEKLIPEQSLRPQRLKPHSKQCTYRSGEPLRHPKSSTTPTSSASCEVVPFPRTCANHSFSAACEDVPNPKPEHNLETVKPVRP
jgi:hypothetical protein